MKSNGDNPVGLWELLKYKIQCFTITFSKPKNKRNKEKIKILEERINELETKLTASASSEQVKELLDSKAELQTYYEHI